MQLDLYTFDWSGVISNDIKPVYKSNMRLFDHFGIPRISLEEWKGRSTLSPVGILSDHGVTAEKKEIDELYEKHLNDVIREGVVPKVYLDAKEVLEFLKNRNKILSVVSSHPENNLLGEAKEYGLKIYFDLILAGSGEEKAERLRKTFTRFGKKPENVIYTGDTFKDIQEAKKAGVHSACVCNGYHERERLEKENPEFVLENLSELKNIELITS
ncbi:MAG: HAD hydrolase-like protein [Candidatus Aenigmarchaeota archaeon]|nr:HAD hydrolase-like protein [Candidatus Aenigmarchaeota archaeon]NIQ17308.1 HAD hydrolase-like protein [Candidatus Aenigmarchaeota archaeon]NIS73675.1 HAD hydrolase-like protein [Candidatus Aenigmarchaeota archaeon]